MKLAVINGPNLNFLGRREPEIYGSQSYSRLEDFIRGVCADEGIEVSIMQSNHEGVIIDAIQAAADGCDGIVINPAGYTHTSVAILDALKAAALPAVEVHLSDPMTREDFRHVSYAGMACIHSIRGLGFEGYARAIRFLKDYIQNR